MSDAPLPSSFDSDADFYNENRWEKFTRRIKEEPLVPFGVGLTCWALFSAARSIRTGDGARTNRMFRYRLYAQSFTIVTMLGGSYYYNADRLKRNDYVKLKKQREALEKKDAWIRELEARDEEDKEWRLKLGKVRDAQYEEAEKRALDEKRARDAARKAQREGANDDGRGIIEAIRQESNASKLKEGRMQELEDEMVGTKPKAKEVSIPAEPRKQSQKERPKTILGESEAGGLFGIGHLKSLWNSRKPKKPDDE